MVNNIQFQSDLEEKGPMWINNESVYIGQWTSDGLREGRGVQMWKDGSKYDGTWKDDMANGYGRLIHSDGDYYQG